MKKSCYKNDDFSFFYSIKKFILLYGGLDMIDYLNVEDSFYNYNKHLYENRNTPVVVIPGLLGSMGSDILPGTGDWDFGMARMIYEPFIEMLEDMGFKKGKDLYIAYYDWRKSCTFSAKEYLYKKIKFIKSKTYASKINLICHSMGGLVARAYLQSDYYENDVKNIIMIGTPNAGSASAYIFWSGGEIYNKGDIKANLIEVIIQGYLWILKKRYNLDSIDVIREKIKGVGDLLPSSDYGSYLYYKDRNEQMIFKPYGLMDAKNVFLDKMNKEKDCLINRGIKVINIGGIERETIKYIQIGNKSEERKWKDGRMIGTTKSNEGDGTVLIKSTNILGNERYILKDDHGGLLLKSKYIIKQSIIRNNKLYRTSDKNKTGCYENCISINIKGMGNIFIKLNKNDNWVNIKEDMKFEKIQVFINKFFDGITWIIVVGDNLRDIKIKYVGFKKELIDILAWKDGKILIKGELKIDSHKEFNLI